MNWPLFKALLLLPGSVLVLVPAVLVWASRDSAGAAHFASPAQAALWVGAIAAVAGLGLAVWTMTLFAKYGQGGTPAPWDPPRAFVVRGPYRHVRNPMMLGVFLLLLAESLLLQSWPIAIWLLVFITANAIYLPASEEPALEARFGVGYRGCGRGIARPGIDRRENFAAALDGRRGGVVVELKAPPSRPILACRPPAPADDATL